MRHGRVRHEFTFAIEPRMTSTRQELLSEIGVFVARFGFNREGANVFVRERHLGIANRITVPVDVPGSGARFSCTVNLMLSAR